MKSLSDELTASEPDIPWKQIARMRNHLAHRYFMTEVEIIRDTAGDDLDPLLAAVERMWALLPPETDDEAEAAEWRLVSASLPPRRGATLLELPSPRRLRHECSRRSQATGGRKCPAWSSRSRAAGAPRPTL